MILFYSEKEEHGYMSNFANYPIIVNGIKFSCNEQYIMYIKAKLFRDEYHAKLIMTLDKPSAMKAAGRNVRNFDQKKWDSNIEGIADTCNLAKFTQHLVLAKRLLATEDAIIAEASPHDSIWGIGVDKYKGRNPDNWNGQNILGNSLMRVRDAIEIVPKKK
jgi:ribA/ribD-fused uncharacterized protein